MNWGCAHRLSADGCVRGSEKRLTDRNVTMTKDKLEQLDILLQKRGVLRNETEALERVLAENPDDLYFNIYKGVWTDKGFLHSCKDWYGYLHEALKKMCVNRKKELAEIQKQIDEL